MKTLDEQIAELEVEVGCNADDAARHRGIAESFARKATEALSRVAELKVQRDAEARKTVGERVAEELVGVRNLATHDKETFQIGSLFLTAPFLSAKSGCEEARKRIAAAIDKAVADERAACLRLAHDGLFSADIADAISNRK